VAGIAFTLWLGVGLFVLIGLGRYILLLLSLLAYFLSWLGE